MKTKFLALIAMIFVATSCSKSDEASAPNNFPADGVIRVATNVDALQTRAGMTTENIENFNLKIVNAVNANYSYYASCYSPAVGEWVYYKDDLITLQTLLWQNSTQPITVTAVSRCEISFKEEDFNKEIVCSVQSDQSTELLLKKSDWLYMPSTVINPATDLVSGKLPITFKHLFSKVDLSVKLGTEFNITPGTATNPITDLKVNGTKTSVNWNPSTNTFDLTISPIDPITAYHNAEGYVVGNGTTGNAVAKYECILIPQTVAANVFTVTFKIGANEYKWTSPNAVTVESGKQYTLALTAGKDIVTAGAFSVANWTDGGLSDVTTD